MPHHSGVLFKPQNYRERRRRESENNLYSAEQGKDLIEKLIEVEDRERIRSIKKSLDEAHEYNRFLIKKHGAEEALTLKDKGLIDYSKLVDYVDAEKVYEMHGDDMQFESGNTNHHPEITLMDLHDLSEEEEPQAADWSQNQELQNFGNSVCLEEHTEKRSLQSSKVIINTMSSKTQPS